VLPFELLGLNNGAQRYLNDLLKKPVPMNQLVQGIFDSIK